MMSISDFGCGGDQINSRKKNDDDDEFIWPKREYEWNNVDQSRSKFVAG